jgi:hypothetical protein
VVGREDRQRAALHHGVEPPLHPRHLCCQRLDAAEGTNRLGLAVDGGGEARIESVGVVHAHAPVPWAF